MKLATKEKRIPTEDEMYKFGAVGCGLNALAPYFGYSTQGFYELISQNNNLWQSMKKGELEANVSVQSKAYEMAVGGEHPALTIFWLKTRCGFREEPIFNFIVQKFGVKEPKNLNPEQLEEIYYTACEVLKEREDLKKIENAKYAVKKRGKKASSLQEHLNHIEEEKNG